MATNNINIPKATYKELASYRPKKNRGFSSIMSVKTTRPSVKNSKGGTTLVIRYCTSTLTSSTEKLEENGGQEEGQFGYFVKEYGWKVRRLGEDESEIRRAAYIQSQAFYEPMRLFNNFFFQVFQAEVLSGLLYKLRASPPNRYACLVAEADTNTTDSTSSDLVGVVDATIWRDNDVLRYLPEAKEYIYVSGIAVSNKFRRRKVATALLKACDKLLKAWEIEYIVLRAYEDDVGALKLYGNAGYNIVSRDPPWMSTWIGRRRRVLMSKPPNKFSDPDA